MAQHKMNRSIEMLTFRGISNGQVPCGARASKILRNENKARVKPILKLCAWGSEGSLGYSVVSGAGVLLVSYIVRSWRLTFH